MENCGGESSFDGHIQEDIEEGQWLQDGGREGEVQVRRQGQACRRDEGPGKVEGQVKGSGGTGG